MPFRLDTGGLLLTMLIELGSAFIYYLLVAVMAFGLLPLAMRILWREPLLAWAVARPVAMTVAGYGMWWTVYLTGKETSWNVGWLWAIFLLISGAAVGYGQWGILKRRLVRYKREIFFGEFITLLVYGFTVLIRGLAVKEYKGDYCMDLSFVTSILFSRQVPVPDPWFSGQSLNYYYFGHYAFAWPAGLAGVPATIAYNCAFALIPALSAGLIYSFCRIISRRSGPGLLGIFLVLFMGNAAFLSQLFNGVPLLDVNVFETSRVILDQIAGNSYRTINEYPLISLVVGNLHSHYLGLPFLLCAVAILFQLMYGRRSLWPGRDGWEFWGNMGILSLLSSTLVASCPFFLLTIAALGAWVLLHHVLAIVRSLHIHRVLFLAGWILPFAAGPFLNHPLLSYYTYPLKQDFPVAWAPVTSSTLSFVILYGILAAMVLPGCIVLAIRRIRPVEAMAAGLLALAAGLWRNNIVVALLVMLVMTAGLMMWREKTTIRRFIFAMIALGAFLFLIPEIVYLSDGYQSLRSNTLFKFHYQAWLLWAMAAPFLILECRRKWIHLIHLSALVLSFVAPLLFIVQTLNQSKGFSLDERGCIRHTDPGAYLALDWLQDHLQPGDVIVEAAGPQYSASARISTLTGLPAPMGWVNHVALHRGDWQIAYEREALVQALYESATPEQSRLIIDKFHIRYLIYGKVEKETYKLSTPERLESLGRLVYQKLDTSIYEIALPDL